MEKNKKLMVSVLVLVVVAGGSFYAGAKFRDSSQTTGFTRGAGGAGGQFAAGMRTRAAGGFTAGDIISKDALGVTVKLADGSTKIVLVSDTTPVMKSASGSLADLSVGTNIVVTGSANTDGSITAQSVQIRPAGGTATGR